MADATEQIIGLVPVAVAGGIAIGMTKSAMGLANGQPRRRRGKGNGKARRSSSNSPWANNPMANGRTQSPW